MSHTGKGRLLDDIALGDKRIIFDGDAEEGWFMTEWSCVAFCVLFICRDAVYTILPIVSDGITDMVRQLLYSCRLDTYIFKSVRIWFCGREQEPINLIGLFSESTVATNFFVVLTKLIDAVDFRLNFGLLLLFC